MQRHHGDTLPQHHVRAGASSCMRVQLPLVGRGAEMDRLAAQLSRAAGGQGCAMFLVGDAGIGKTRLAHEALALARERGFLVLEGSAYALEGRLAYAPILAAFGPFLRRLDSPRQARLVSGLPDLGRLFTDLRLPAPLPLGDPALEKTRLFEAVARLLERLTRETPVFLFLDDLHWADPASIELLHYLILGRLQHLDATEHRVLDLIAVSGGTVPHVVLREAGEWSDEVVLLQAVQRLCTTGLVVENVDGAEVTYILTHPLIQEVAYAELPEMARRSAHAAVAFALERVRPDDLDRLARHYHAAGSLADANRTLEVLLAAGERAYGLYANDQAARHFGAALALMREGRRTELLPSVLEQLGEAWERVGETAAAISVWSEARTLHERTSNTSLIVRLHRRLALAEGNRGHFGVAQAHLEAGPQVLAGSKPSAELADLLHVRVILLGRRGDDKGLSTAATDLAILAERLGSRRVLVEAYFAQIRSFSADRDVVVARELAQRALNEAEVADEPLLVQRAHDILALFAYALGEHSVASHHATFSLALARQLIAPTLEVYPRNRLVSVDLMAGKWDEALRESAEVVTTARRLGFARGIAGALGMRALVHVYRRDLDEAAASLAEAHEAFGGGAMLDRHIFSQVAITELMLALERADAAGILAALSRLDQMLTPTDFPLLVQALLAEAQVMVGEPERALTLAQDFMAHIPPDNVFAAALGNRIKGLALQALGQPGEALVCLVQACRAFEAPAMPFDAARAHLEWATLVATTDVALAVPAVPESLAVF